MATLRLIVVSRVPGLAGGAGPHPWSAPAQDPAEHLSSEPFGRWFDVVAHRRNVTHVSW
ncbi:hypothetical protein [Actinomadura vinacea]|uniref:hypothetical protein n=1 Tax=Actinomadura vinacea TaxID=115336 RepID=UPI0031D30F0C